MVELLRDSEARARARLLDLSPGRSGAVYADWLKEPNEAFRAGIKVATLDPFQGCKIALDDERRGRHRRPRRVPCREARDRRWGGDEQKARLDKAVDADERHED